MVYYQGRERQNLLDEKVFSRDSFSSTELSSSRDSSFSSCSSSATGSSGYGCALDTDSSISRLDDRLDSTFTRAMTKADDYPCARKQPALRSKHRSERIPLSRKTRELHESSGNRNSAHPNKETVDKERNPSRHGFNFQDRSRSETELILPTSHLSSPEGLIISTPPAKGTHLSTTNDKRARSKSESYDEKSTPKIEKEKAKDLKKLKSEEAKRRETTAVDWCIDEATMRRCLILSASTERRRKEHEMKDASKRIAALESQVEQVCQERDNALRERNEVMHDRDRIKCERDELELKRDKLLLDKKRLEKELINRNNVIDHLKEHLGLAAFPVKLPARTFNSKISVQAPKEKLTTYEHDTSAASKFKTRPRSKSEIKTPAEFYFPDQYQTNAYTCL